MSRRSGSSRLSHWATGRFLFFSQQSSAETGPGPGMVLHSPRTDVEIVRWCGRIGGIFGISGSLLTLYSVGRLLCALHASGLSRRIGGKGSKADTFFFFLFLFCMSIGDFFLAFLSHLDWATYRTRKHFALSKASFWRSGHLYQSCLQRLWPWRLTSCSNR